MIDEPQDVEVDWERVAALRGQGMDAAAALEQARTEYDEQPPELDLGDDAADGRTCPSVESISWVASQLRKKFSDLASAPSETALGLLEWAQSSPVAKAEFWKSLWSRTLPTRSEIEHEARYRDDGSSEIELAERILERVERQTAEDEQQRKLRLAEYQRTCT